MSSNTILIVEDETIVKRAVQKLNGTLRVESEAGKGGTFYVHIPNSVANIHGLSGEFT